jgi:hypothetical protein
MAVKLRRQDKETIALIQIKLNEAEDLSVELVDSLFSGDM